MGLLDDAIREHLDLKRRRGADPQEIERLERDALGPVRREPTGPPVSSDRITAAARLDQDDFDDALESHGNEYPRALSEHEERLADDYDDERIEDHPTEIHTTIEQPVEESTPQPRRGFLGRRRRNADRQESEELHDKPREVPTDKPELPEFDDEFADDEPVYHEQPAEQSPPEATGPPSLTFESPPPKRPRVDDLLSEVPVESEAMEQGEPEAAAPAQEEHEAEEWGDDTQMFDASDLEVEDDENPEQAPSADEDVLEETPDFLQDTPDHDRLWFEQKPPRDFDFDG